MDAVRSRQALTLKVLPWRRYVTGFVGLINRWIEVSTHTVTRTSNGAATQMVHVLPVVQLVMISPHPNLCVVQSFTRLLKTENLKISNVIK